MDAERTERVVAAAIAWAHQVGMVCGDVERELYRAVADYETGEDPGEVDEMWGDETDD